MGGNGGGIVPICPSLSVHRGTRVEPRVGQLVVCVGLAGQLAGRLTVWVGGGEGWSVISVMIFMDVSQNKALAELEADQSPIHLQMFSLLAAILLHPGTVCLVLIFTIHADPPPAKFNTVPHIKHNKSISCLVMGEESKFWI